MNADVRFFLITGYASCPVGVLTGNTLECLH
jgi:hypothetical protein